MNSLSVRNSQRIHELVARKGLDKDGGLYLTGHYGCVSHIYEDVTPILTSLPQCAYVLIALHLAYELGLKDGQSDKLDNRVERDLRGVTGLEVISEKCAYV